MRSELLPDREAEVLRRAALTYAEVGRTRGDLPDGYRHLRRAVVLGTGTQRFDEASKALLGWDMQRRAGVSVRPSAEKVAEDSVAVLRLGGGWAGVNAPVRVVYVVDEARRQGVAYGTLPGHPECGEESFVIELLDDGEVRFTISAFSRPATLLARLGGPVSRAVQRWVTHRYSRAL